MGLRLDLIKGKIEDRPDFNFVSILIEFEQIFIDVQPSDIISIALRMAMASAVYELDKLHKFGITTTHPTSNPSSSELDLNPSLNIEISHGSFLYFPRLTVESIY